jgi:chaperonin GroES
VTGVQTCALPIYGGTELKYNNEEYLVLSARDVLAIVVR